MVWCYIWFRLEPCMTPIQKHEYNPWPNRCKSSEPFSLIHRIIVIHTLIGRTVRFRIGSAYLPCRQESVICMSMNYVSYFENERNEKNNVLFAKSCHFENRLIDWWFGYRTAENVPYHGSLQSQGPFSRQWKREKHCRLVQGKLPWLYLHTATLPLPLLSVDSSCKPCNDKHVI